MEKEGKVTTDGTRGQGDSGGLRRKTGHEVKCSRGAKALWGHKEGKGNETQRKRKKRFLNNSKKNHVREKT